MNTTTLDAVFPLSTGAGVDVLKIDVESHELRVLQWASELLTGRRVRHIIFQEHGCYPAPVHAFLESHGYTIYRLTGTLVRVSVREPGDVSENLPDVMPNYLATTEPDTVKRAFAPWGWTTLRRSLDSRAVEPVET